MRSCGTTATWNARRRRASCKPSADSTSARYGKLNETGSECREMQTTPALQQRPPVLARQRVRRPRRHRRNNQKCVVKKAEGFLRFFCDGLLLILTRSPITNERERPRIPPRSLLHRSRGRLHSEGHPPCNPCLYCRPNSNADQRHLASVRKVSHKRIAASPCAEGKFRRSTGASGPRGRQNSQNHSRQQRTRVVGEDPSFICVKE